MSDFAARDIFEARIQQAVGALQQRQLDRLMEAMGTPPRLGNVPASLWTEFRHEMIDLVTPMLRDVYNSSAVQFAHGLPVGVDWNQVNERAASWAEKHAGVLIKKVDRHSLDVVRKAVPQYFRQDWTMDVLRAKLAPTFGPVRASAIATSEVTTAAAEGQLGVVREIKALNPGIVMVGIWNTNNDAIVRRCDVCWPLHNVRANKHGWFIHPKTGMAYRKPYAHTRCRCWLTHEIVRDPTRMTNG